MGVAARDADILELVVRHLQKREATAPALKHAINVFGGGTEHKYQATNEATTAPWIGLRAKCRTGVANCVDCTHFHATLSRLYLFNRRLDMN